jgi:hypothetical protein
METQVRGRAILGLIRFIKDDFGPDVLQEIIRDGGPVLKEMFSSRIRITGWYSYKAYTDFLCAIANRLQQGDSDFFRKVGNKTGTIDMSTILRVYVTIASSERLIRSCTKVWESTYNNAGRMEAISWSPDTTVLRIYDFPQMHPYHCSLVAGWMIATMDSIGLKVDPGSKETKCTNKGDDYHEFCATWRKK